MASWDEVMVADTDLAARVQARFDAHKHKVLATLRPDGSPRISGVEATFHDGDLWLGMMPESLKAHDLLRDPRLALHSATVDPEMADGDARIAGRAVAVTDLETFEAFLAARGDEDGAHEPGGFHLFRVDVTELVLIAIGDPPDHLVIESWREGRGSKRVERA